MVDTILFDFFGTLTEYIPGSYFKLGRKKAYTFLLKNSFNVSYDEFASHCSSAYKELDTIAKNTLVEFHMFELLKYMFEEKFSANTSDELIKEFNRIYLEEWNEDIHYLPGIKNFIKKLGTKYKLGIVTNTHFSDLIFRNLNKMEITSYFSTVVTSIDFGKRKPNMDIFNYALKQMKSKPDCTIFVGDSYNDDYMGAKYASLKPILIDANNKYPDVPERITSLFKLTDFLKN